MEIKVAKFGGSSVADAIQINKIKNIVDADETRRYIIVSAPGKRFDNDSKVTDLLYSCMMHKEHNLPFDHLFSRDASEPRYNRPSHNSFPSISRITAPTRLWTALDKNRFGLD